ncbi:MAG: thioredoxin domain-containing protein [Gemmatimonadetes bacterium]|nr:thioredoxin domain-containing protein [Gemmatimonadota bacterium]
MDVERRRLLDTIVSLVLACCAVIVTGGFVWRNFGSGGPAASSTRELRAVRRIDNWQALVGSGRLIKGSTTAPVTILEFADFECPACRSFFQELSGGPGGTAPDVGVVFQHFPLNYHRFAIPAARASECAHEQGRFTEMHDAIFRSQDSLGLKTWESYAMDAQVAGMDEFRNCVSRSGSLPAVDSGLQRGHEVPVEGTPTVILNGWLVNRPPRAAELAALIEEVRQGRRIEEILR